MTPVRPELLHVIISPDPRELPADPATFSVTATFYVGSAGGFGAEVFEVEVCTPEWLLRQCQETREFIDGRHKLITTLDNFSEDGVEQFLRRRIQSISGETWDEVAEKVGRLGFWEFEDYEEHQSRASEERESSGTTTSPSSGTDYSVLSTRGGGQVTTVARAALEGLDARLATVAGAKREDLEAIRREVAELEASPYRPRTRRTLAAMRRVRSWPADDPLRGQIEHLNFLLQRPLP